MLEATETLATVEQADDYAAKMGWTDWSALNTAQKEANLRQATLYILANYQWDGSRFPYGTAETAWPYEYVSLGGEAVYEQPQGVTTATIEAARLAISGPLMGGQTAGARQVRRVRIDKIEREYEPSSRAADDNARLALVDAILRATGARGTSSGFGVPLRRAL